ncbi:TPA: ABC transporter permease [Vibrio parahaemolyticus]|uniref:ABC transporter permease n=1 Tax=Vibrio parahaemolyticus TaxID=670 RepID=UPI00186A64A2|nr:ABC transporter permease [Vibrio parahaemolyticus]EHH1222572.1 ABC transporter permease [Vibrio parahaemolyticus]EIY8171260.1 ABC transporter permease [Vibrio parahaemolyticus]EIY8249760.1 ABC transporter permease [Vibrio parahaemolyticus]EJC6861912.1 ABC transporter permease [Vibrio parahaemolyticus]EJC7039555.1 ABC transporter permease [Vibrio parahaemolyticus]
MNSVVDISWAKLAAFSLILLVPLAINARYRLGIAKDASVSVVRMTLQLVLIGVYLEYLFQLNSLIINLLWLAIMLVVGASSIAGKARLPKKPLMLPLLTGLICGLFPLLIAITAGLVRPTPLYNAQYMIPLAGMLLGNSLSSNIIALQNLFSAFEERKSEYEAAISLGAAPKYASFPFVQEALRKSLAPTLASMTTMGLVTLPGMMTGQILGGASPLVAIKYQLVIMLAIFVMMSVSVAITLEMTLSFVQTKEGRVTVKVRPVDGMKRGQ